MVTDRNQHDAEAPVRFPVLVDVLPEKLKVRVYLHEILTSPGPVSCWSFVTEGLWVQRQKELILTVRRQDWEEPEDYPTAVFEFFKQVYELAKAQRLVDVGSYSEFAAAGFLGRDVKGLAYIILAHSRSQALKLLFFHVSPPFFSLTMKWRLPKTSV